MTELEQTLSSALNQLATQYKEDMERLEGQNAKLAEQNRNLQQQVNDLSNRINLLSNQIGQLTNAYDNFAKILNEQSE